jgi:hypothetical protein
VHTAALSGLRMPPSTATPLTVVWLAGDRVVGTRAAVCTCRETLASGCR